MKMVSFWIAPDEWERRPPPAYPPESYDALQGQPPIPSARLLDTERVLDRKLYRWLSSTSASVDLMILTSDAELCSSHVDPQTQSSLMMLPAEIHLSINAFLDFPSSVCWTLSCKRAALAIGLKSWIAIKGQASLVRLEDSASQKRHLLVLLEKEFPSYHLCYYSQRLCKTALSIGEWTKPHKGERKCMIRTNRLRPDPDTPSRRWFAPTFCEVKLIMQRWFHGPPHGLSLDFLDVSEVAWQCLAVRRHDHYIDPKWPIPIAYFSKIDIKSQIVDNELQLQVCHRILVSNSEALEVCSNKTRFLNPFYHSPFLDVYTCQHYKWDAGRSRSDSIISVIDDAMRTPRELKTNGHDGIPIPPSKTLACLTCQTESRFTAIAHEGAGIELIAELWQNLGSGQHLHALGWSACYHNSESGLQCKLPKLPVNSGVDIETAQAAQQRWANVSVETAAARVEMEKRVSERRARQWGPIQATLRAYIEKHDNFLARKFKKRGRDFFKKMWNN